MLEPIVTIREVAELAGVKDATVSRAFSGKAPVAAATRQRVMEAAAQLGYRPSVAARAIRTGRTGFIGMIRSHRISFSVHNPGFDFGVDSALHERGLCLVRDMVDAQADEAPRIVREDSVDGLLINYAFGTPPLVRDFLDRCRIAAIWINRKREHNCVHPDDEQAAYDATCYLLGHGHRRITYVGGRRGPNEGQIDPHYSGPDRQAGYLRAMAEAGASPRIEEIPPASEAGGPVGYGMRAMGTLLDRPARATAFLCAGDWGYGAHAAALQRGLRVPDDVSLMCIDSASQDFEIAIDRTLVDYRTMGRTAVEELCEVIKAPDTSRSPVVIPFLLHQAGTVAAPND